MTDREEIINELVKHIESALAIDSDYVDSVRTDLLQYTVALLKEKDKVMGQAVVITTMHDLPEGCYDNCPLCHDGYCLGLSVSDSGWPYQPAQEVRPYNCPLKIKETD